VSQDSDAGEDDGIPDEDAVTSEDDGLSHRDEDAVPAVDAALVVTVRG
jgi:hypothetical protein